MRDLRDPEAVGTILKALVLRKVPVLQAADELSAYAVKDYASPDCVGRYGKPQDVKPLFMEVQVR